MSSHQLLAAFVSTLAIAARSAADHRTPTCIGHAATLRGTPGADQIVGTQRRDVIVGGRGNDAINGLGGDDLAVRRAGPRRPPRTRRTRPHLGPLLLRLTFSRGLGSEPILCDEGKYPVGRLRQHGATVARSRRPRKGGETFD